MKTRRYAIPGLLILLGVFTADGFPPRMHSARGVVSSVDTKAYRLSLRVCCDTEEFVWRKWTRVRLPGGEKKPANIPIGTPVRVSFRRELGQNVLYEVPPIGSGQAR